MTTKQKQGILNALKTGGNVTIKPTRVQCGGILGSLLASIGIPLAADLVSKVLGKGAPRLGTPHPFFLEHGIIPQSLQLNSANKSNLVKPKFHQNIPMSNFDLLSWCKDLGIPINKMRISKFKRKVFDRGYTPNWTKEIFTINKIQNTNPITQLIKDLKNEFLWT